MPQPISIKSSDRSTVQDPKSPTTALRTLSPPNVQGSSGEEEEESESSSQAANLSKRHPSGIHLHKRQHSSESNRIRKRDRVKMVGHHLHSAFKTWFKDTESDGTPILPHPLSKKYNITEKVLGQGSFALVKLVQMKSTGEERALKIIAKKPLKDNNEKMLKDEIAILGRVEHPHIIKMWDLYETKEAVFIVTDLCRGGELFDRLVEKVHYNELDARHITRQMFEGIDYLHDHDIIHRDLKPENILLREKSEPSQIVISDFGLSRFIPEDGHLLMTACGSPQYVAPEILLGRGYDAAVDIWSGGVIAYCLLAGYTPFYGEDQPTLFQQILGMKVEFEPEYWSDVSETAKDFILRCLCPREKRMTAKEALKHPYLADLPPIDGKDSHKGASLKNSALRHQNTKNKFNRVVTTIEAANYLQHLHDLRREHSTDIHPERLHSLLRLATHISNHSTWSGDHAKEEKEKNASVDTIVGHNEKKENNGSGIGDSGMSLDLIIMSAFVPDPAKQMEKMRQGGTAAVAAAANATQHGENPVEEKVGDGEGEASQKKNYAEDSPTPPGSEYSDSTATPARVRSSTNDSRSSSAGQSQRSRTYRSHRKSSKSSKTLDALLDQYKTSALPTTARTDPKAEPNQPGGMTLTKVWKYVPFLVNTTYSLGSALASHAFYGPPKKSWGLEMSIFTRIMRDTAKYSEFATVAGLQQFFDLSSFLPVPKDGLITPVTYRVKKRNLRGLLKEADAAEDGTRELTGEWVVGKQTWRRLQSDWRNGKSTTSKERVILYIHGGAYFVMSAVTHRPLTISLSKYTECRLFAINYRLAPDCQFPGPLHDVVSSWFRLVDDLGIPPSNIVIGGDSAGGGLTLALLYYLRDNKYELPSGAILFSPWVDLTMSCDSWETNSPYDYLPLTPSTDHMNPVRAYLGENMERLITHPYASPLFGDLRGLPPLLIQCGDAEVLRDEVTLLAHKASLAGVAVRHELYEDCVHVFQAFLFLDASRKALQSARHFVRTALDKRGKRKTDMEKKSRTEMDDEMRKGMENEDGEIVDAKTGERVGSSRDVRGGIESDSESMNRSVHDRSDDEWKEFDEESPRRASTPNKSQPSSAELLRSKSQPHSSGTSEKSSAKTSSSSKPTPRYRQDSAPATPYGEQPPSSRTRPPRSTSSASISSLTSMSLEQARSRAQAGLRMQESKDAPQLAKFHGLNKPLQPRMRRSASNATINNLIQSWEAEHGASGLNTRVYTPNE